MTLTLTVLRCPDAVAPETRLVTGGEFSIGRGPDNDWVLPDPDRHLSKRHCILAYRRGGWQIAGTSSNGTFLNRDGEPLEPGPPRALEDGDRIRLGPYEIEARVQDEHARAGFAGAAQPSRQLPFTGGLSTADPFGDDPFGASAPERQPLSGGAGVAAEGGFGATGPSIMLPAEFDPLAPDPAEEADPGPTHADHSAAVMDALNMPPPRPVLPDDWDVDLSAPAKAVRTPRPPPDPAPTAIAPASAPEPEPAPVSAAPCASRPGEADLLAAFLRGAGMADAVPPDPVRAMEQLGAAFRALVSGVRQVLIARSAVKSEFRIEQTMIRRSGNNPLKFSAGDDDALAGLLGAGRRFDMSAEEAVADALSDIRLHELASMAAMQEAVRALVARLAPEAVRRAADQSGGIALPGARKARAWDIFESLHAEVARGLSDDFDSVFGKNFARGYEQALTELAGRDRRER